MRPSPAPPLRVCTTPRRKRLVSSGSASSGVIRMVQSGCTAFRQRRRYARRVAVKHQRRRDRRRRWMFGQQQSIGRRQRVQIGVEPHFVVQGRAGADVGEGGDQQAMRHLRIVVQRRGERTAPRAGLRQESAEFVRADKARQFPIQVFQRRFGHRERGAVAGEVAVGDQMHEVDAASRQCITHPQQPGAGKLSRRVSDAAGAVGHGKRFSPLRVVEYHAAVVNAVIHQADGSSPPSARRR